VRRPFVDPLGLQLVIGRVRATDIERLAAREDVIEIWPSSGVIEPPHPPDPDIPKRSPERLAQGNRVATKDWYEATDVHRFRQAWGRGFTGNGVKVMVNDSGIDFCHPDLQDTWALIDDPQSPYYGWPLVFDANSMYLLARDQQLGEHNIEEGRAHYADTSQTCAAGSTCSYSPIGASQSFDYALPGTSLGGTYRIGSHPDTTLDRGEGRAAILLADEAVAGDYDTVYVDLNQNHDFTDDPMATRTSPGACGSYDPGTYSGGLVYFIADGTNPIPASDWLWGLGPPSAGDVVAFAIDDTNENGSGHGTKCASWVAAQGVVNGGAPSFKPAYQEPGDGMVVGGGRDAKLIAVGNTFLYPGLAEPFLLAALGVDGVPSTADDAQIVTNSWSYSTVDNDGWDLGTRLVDTIQQDYGPSLSVVFSAGNGGPAYGSVAGPSPETAVMVGAATEMGSTGWDGIRSAEQIRWGDMIPFSSRGPGARGTVGVDVAAVGAYASGDITVNESSDDVEAAWGTFGGTSRACPVAGGTLALVYDAYRQAHGEWPDHETAKAILMAGSDDLNHDPFNQGAGLVNAERATDIAAGAAGGVGGGFYAMPPQWSAGDYRGSTFPMFANILHPSQSATTSFTVYNTSDTATEVALSSQKLVKFGSTSFNWTTSQLAVEDEYDFNTPNYLYEITDLVPEETELLVIRVIQPLAEIDPDSDYEAESRWRFMPYDWSDDGDGVFWSDLDGNGTVNAGELDSDDAYVRYTYDKNVGTSQQLRVQRPLERMHDGIWLGLQHSHTDQAVPESHFQVRLDFYRHQVWDWIGVPGSVQVPAGGSTELEATLSVPADARLGMHEGALTLSVGETRSTVPVSVVVAARFAGDAVVFAGGDSTTPYGNGTVGGLFSWTARAYDGDWRFYFFDVPGQQADGARLLVHTSWQDTPLTDVDTIVLGPVANDEYSTAYPDRYGPYRLDDVGHSPNWRYGGGTWGYNTSSGGSDDWVNAPLSEGLHAILLHNVLYQGTLDTFEVPVTVTVGVLEAPSGPIRINSTYPTGRLTLEVESGFAIEEFEAQAFGLVCEPRTESGLVIEDDEFELDIPVEHCGRLNVSLSGEGGDDLDLWLYHPDGYPTLTSSSGGAEEAVSMRLPVDGTWVAHVLADEIGGLTSVFELTVDAIEGTDLAVVGAPSGPIPSGATIPIEISYSVPPESDCDVLRGLLVYGPRGGQVVEVPIEVLTRTTRRATRRVAP
jgi:hypothetical protein